jgi:hypothetical protein
MSMTDRGNIMPGLQGPQTFKETPTVTQTISAQLSRASGVSNFATPILDNTKRWGLLLWDAFQVYWNAYPSIRAFTYMWGIMTAIPNVIFLSYTVVTLGICTAIAAAGVAIVEGGLLAISLFFMVPILFVSFWVCLAVVGVLTAVLYGLRALSMSLSTTQDVTGLRTGISGGTLNLAKNVAAYGADTMESIESAILGREGMPVPVFGRV